MRGPALPSSIAFELTFKPFVGYIKGHNFQQLMYAIQSGTDFIESETAICLFGLWNASVQHVKFA